jgi:hypothetical protein
MGWPAEWQRLNAFQEFEVPAPVRLVYLRIQGGCPSVGTAGPISWEPTAKSSALKDISFEQLTILQNPVGIEMAERSL